MKKITAIILSCSLFLFVSTAHSVPEVTGSPVIVLQVPFLTQINSSDINDLHGDLDCDFIISTAGNYHFALLEALQGRSDLGFEGLQTILQRDYGLKVCWSTSPPISVEQVVTEKLQFKNITVHGKPALVMGPGGVM